MAVPDLDWGWCEDLVLLAVGEFENRLHPELVLSSLDVSNKGFEGWTLPGAPLCG